MKLLKLWIARDKDGELYIFETKPDLDIDMFQNCLMEDYNWFEKIPDHWFPGVTFENSPQEVELKLVEK